MSQIIINNGDQGLVVRNNLNTMFGELYGAIFVPNKISNIAANTTFPLTANSFIDYIALTTVSGTPTIRIGTTPNGTDIQPDIQPGNFALNSLQQYFANATTLYITITGGGVVNLRMVLLNNYF